MPSEPHATRPPSDGRRWDWLFSQGLGVICGQTTVGLLAIGSVVLAATRDGASARIGMDDVRAFFAPPSVVHLWFYLLIPLLSLYALNTTLATCRSVLRKWRGGARAPHLYAPAVVHAAFLVGLLAHAIGGLGGAELGHVALGADWKELWDGRQARVTELYVDRHRDGGVKQVRAGVEVRDSDGAVTPITVQYNGPISRGLGSDLMLLIRPDREPAARLVRGADSCRVAVEGGCDLGGLRVELLFVHPPQKKGGAPLARLRTRNAAGSETGAFWLPQGASRPLGDGSRLVFAGLEASPVLRLRHRHAPGDPWALLASVLLAAGLAMMWRRFLPPGRRVPHNGRGARAPAARLGP